MPSCSTSTTTTSQLHQTQVQLSRFSMYEPLLSLGVLNMSGRIQRSDREAFGTGSYAKVYKYVTSPHSSFPQELYAVKDITYTKKDMKTDQIKRTREKVMREVKIWSAFKHANVLELCGVVWDEERVLPLLVSPFMENGTADKFAKTNERANLMHMACDIVHGLSYIHSRNCVHGDLKCNNLLITSAGRVQIADFGMSRIVNEAGIPEDMSTHDGARCGRYVAPELFSNVDEVRQPPTRQSDVWSFGSTLLHLFSGEAPYFGMSNEEAIVASSRRIKPKFPSECINRRFERYRDVIVGICQFCWVIDADLRPDIVALREFIKSYCLKEGHTPGSHPSSHSHEQAQLTGDGTYSCMKRSTTMPMRRPPAANLVRGTEDGILGLSLPYIHAEPGLGSLRSGIFPRTPSISSSPTSSLTSSSPLRENGLYIMNDNRHRPWCAYPPPPSLATASMIPPGANVRSFLNEYCQKRDLALDFPPPSAMGSSHLPSFSQTVKINGVDYGTSRGQANKKKAIEAASLLALEKLDNEASIGNKLLNYKPTFDEHTRQHGIVTKLKWETNAQSGGGFTAKLLVDDIALAEADGIGPNEAKEKAAQAAARRWRSDCNAAD